MKLRGPGSSLRFKEDRMKEKKQRRNYVAICNVVPERGMTLNVWRFESDFGHFFPEPVTISTIERVDQLAGNMFRVETRNNTYYVQIITVGWTNVYVAFGLTSPRLGGRMQCISVKPINSRLEVITVNTSTIRRIEYIGSIFKIETENSVYYVQPK